MKKPVLGSMLVVLLLSSVPAFAQFKNPVKAAKNLANLDRVVARVTTKSPILSARALAYKSPVSAKLPLGVVIPENAGLVRAQLPKNITPVNKSYFTFVRDWYNSHNWESDYQTLENASKSLENLIKKSFPNASYTQQEQLAKDLDAFYKGQAKVYIGPDGRQVKLYALPVDGILYKPVGYEVPVVLNASEYFVIFDVESQTGKIADNIPEVYNLYKPAMEEEIYGEFEDYEVAPGVGSWRPKDPRQYYRWNRDLMRDNPWRAEDWRNGNYPSRFESQNDLGNALHSFYCNDVPKVQKRFTQDVFNVYELPVDGIVYQGEGQLEPTELFPSSYVVLYNEKTGGQIVARSTLKNQFFFEFVK